MTTYSAASDMFSSSQFRKEVTGLLSARRSRNGDLFVCHQLSVTALLTIIIPIMDVATDLASPGNEPGNTLSCDNSIAYEQQIQTTNEDDPRSNLASRIGTTKIYLLAEAQGTKVCPFTKSLFFGMQNLIPALLSIWRFLLCDSECKCRYFPYQMRPWPGGIIHGSRTLIELLYSVSARMKKSSSTAKNP